MNTYLQIIGTFTKILNLIPLTNLITFKTVIHIELILHNN